jgi:hypothetical protein
LVLVLSGESLSLSSVTGSSAYFDFAGNGFAARTGWISPNEGILVLGSRQAGPATPYQVLGAQSGDGFADLARLDGDGNGVINSGDIHSLVSLGITSISLASTPANQVINGNTVVSTGRTCGRARQSIALYPPHRS